MKETVDIHFTHAEVMGLIKCILYRNFRVKSRPDELKSAFRKLDLAEDIFQHIKGEPVFVR